MANISFLILAVAALLLLMAIAFPVEGAAAGNLKPSECSSKCSERCQDTGHLKACLSYCNKCCAKCLCVPPTHYCDKRPSCPCYTNWKTKDGGPMCP